MAQPMVPNEYNNIDASQSNVQFPGHMAAFFYVGNLFFKQGTTMIFICQFVVNGPCIAAHSQHGSQPQ
jgi:hypothetical protein